ncbi:MAG: transporter substrate-binding protein [Frankiales bacterium]|nr:transporter substrate-binding protein [Frankiales bacterium]
MRRLGVVVALLLVAACGGSPTATRTATTAAAGPSSSADPAAGPVTVFAASSLTEVFTALGALYERQHPGAHVTFSFAGSQSLVAQVQQGAPADVLATADAKSAASVQAELAAAPVVLARNHLAIVTEKGDPLRLRTLADLARAGVKVVLAGPTVPAGKAARAALAAAGVTVHPVSEEPDVKAVVQKVRLGEADAGVVYATDRRAAGADVGGVDLPGVSNAYPAAPLKEAAHAAAARAFLALAGSPEGQAVFARFGFLPPG